MNNKERVACKAKQAINRIEVLMNDYDIKRQVPGITTQKEKLSSMTPLKAQELFYRATDYRGS